MRGDEYGSLSGAATSTALIAFLGRTATDDVLDLLQANAETLIRTKANRWLVAHPAPAEF